MVCGEKMNQYIITTNIGEELSNKILKDICAKAQWKNALVGHDFKAVEHQARTNKDFSITTCPELKETDQELFKIFGEGLKNYTEKTYPLRVQRDEGYTALKYEAGEFYKPHADAEGGTSFDERQLSAILYLNDDYEGGELEFPKLGVKIKPKKGDLVFFPSNFCFVHASLPIVTGTKYAVVTWLR